MSRNSVDYGNMKIPSMQEKNFKKWWRCTSGDAVIEYRSQSNFPYGIIKYIQYNTIQEEVQTQNVMLPLSAEMKRDRTIKFIAV